MVALASPHPPHARVAFEVGYASEVAFNRAFKRESGALRATWLDGRTRPAD